MTSEVLEQPRLNPFAFVSDTTLRFMLLVVVVTCASLERWSGIAVMTFDLASTMRGCLDNKPFGVDVLSEAGSAGFITCFRQVAVRTVPTMAIGIGLLVLVATVIYMVFPAWQIRKRQMQRFDPADCPPLQEALAELCLTAGLRRLPEFWWNPLVRRSAALAFGTKRRPRIALTGGLAGLYFANPAAFRAILLHELAHVRMATSARPTARSPWCWLSFAPRCSPMFWSTCAILGRSTMFCFW
jgi:Zn-dependent protease with chaperone function